MAEALPDADVLRVLELHVSGLNRKAIVQQTQLHNFDVHRIVTGKKTLRTQRVIAKYPEWSAKFRHLLGLEDDGVDGTAENDGSSKLSGAPVSEYEAKRLQRMGENQAVLAALGMQKLAPKRAAPSGPSRAILEREAARKNPRRSSRISAFTESTGSSAGASALINEASALALTRAEQDALFTDRKPPVPYQGLDLPIVDLSVPVVVPDIKPELTAQQRSQPPPVRKQRVSSQQLDIDFESFHARWLGNQIWPKGKQTVMQGMCPSHIPTFSKMSGVQAWKNAVVLFVNVQGESQYDNVFHQVASTLTEMQATPSQEDVPVKKEEAKSELTDGINSPVYFQWFAQHRQHLASPVIMRLLNAQKGDASLRLEDASYFDQDNQEQQATDSDVALRDPVLLFIRHVDGPYIYCGRLGFLGFRSGSSPLEFRWQLLDAASLAWSEIRTLIESSNTQVEGAAVVEDGDM